MKQVNTPSEFIYDIPAHLTTFEQSYSRGGEKINEDLFGGLEERVVTLPGLIESSSHRASLAKNMNVLTQIIGRNDSEYYKFIEG
jgi:hypothetical protein